jgi:NAD(P)-dependent dehydrogenase (short-subunit alcohol dehydrogenase family)
MQVAATIVPALHLPDAITSAVVVATLFGFPIALVLAWAFELTSEGIKRAEDVLPTDSITHRGSEGSSPIESQTPLGRIGQPDDIGPVAVFLASEDARWVTGQALLVSGGHR